MKLNKSRWSLVAVAAGAALVMTAFGLDENERAEDQRTAEQILAELEQHEKFREVIDAMEPHDAETRALHRAKDNLYRVKKVKLIGDLWRADPTRPELAELMGYRWQNSANIWQLDVSEELDEFAKLHPDAEDALRDGWYHHAQGTIRREFQNADLQLEVADAFIERFPDDERAAALLDMVGQFGNNEELRAQIIDRILTDYPESRHAKRALGERRQQEAIGQPFELAFTNVLNGKEITMEDLRGQVVVIDFWATWCGPCIAEIPHLKELYERYHESGLEIIGISLDEQVQTVVDYCTEHEMPWPQLCIDDVGWETPIATEWGIRGIPTIFIIDRDGNLYSANARGQLDELIPKLLGMPAQDS
jgi:thiol-disulfide isomerase/thioredoxin